MPDGLYLQYDRRQPRLGRKGMAVSEYDRLSYFTLRHKISLVFYVFCCGSLFVLSYLCNVL